MIARFRLLYSTASLAAVRPASGLDQFFEDAKFLSLANCHRSTHRPAGRAWSAPELRRKSFDDLHQLWYVLLKEKNLLFTQQAEANRLGVCWLEQERLDSVFVGMARIKSVLTERRLAFEGARAIAEGSKDSKDPKEAYIKEMMHIKKNKHGFRRLLRFILRKHPHFD